MSESMIERVARAIYALHPIEDNEFDGEGYDIDEPRTLSWEESVGAGLAQVFLAEARAAIEAMREIPGKIGDAGYDAFEAWERGESTAILPHGPIWRAMIDAALLDGTT